MRATRARAAQTRRTAEILKPRDRDSLDGRHGLPPCVAPDRGLPSVACAVKVKENTDDLTMSSSPGSGRVQKGTANVAETGTAACKSRAVLSAHDETLVSEMGYRRCHGEAPRMNVREVEADAGSLCMEGRPATAGMSPESGWIEVLRLDAFAFGCTAPLSRNGTQPVRPGVKSDTYSTEDFSFEHGNPDLSARNVRPGELPGPATSQAGGRVLVVVRARESRVHGEGGQ